MMNRFILSLLILSMVIFLSGCGGKERRYVALIRYIKTVKQRPATNMSPLFSLETKAPFSYSGEHRRDPFRPVTEKIIQGVPSYHGKVEVLEGFPLDSLRMVGTVKRGNNLWALIAAGNGNIYRVTVGNYMGQHYGKIQTVTYEHVGLEEKIFTKEKGWLKRNVTIDFSGLIDQGN